MRWLAPSVSTASADCATGHGRHRAVEHHLSRPRARRCASPWRNRADALLAHLAPLGWQHINLTGDYLWDADSLPASDGFRQLRQSSVAPLEAAVA